MHQAARTVLYLSLVVFLAACSLLPGTGNRVSGTISYEETMYLTPEAEVEIKLLDTSLQDVKATEIAATKIANPGQVPISFSLDYDPALIKDGMSYSIRADIYDRNRRLFTTDTNHGVITRGNSNKVAMTLIPLRSNPISKPDASLTETYWKVIAVYDQPLQPVEGQRETHIKFRESLGGYAGCNNFSGGYKVAGNKLTIGPLAVTLMACPQGMDTEQSFLQAIAEADRFDIIGDTMVLYRQDKIIMHLEAIYF